MEASLVRISLYNKGGTPFGSQEEDGSVHDEESDEPEEVNTVDVISLQIKFYHSFERLLEDGSTNILTEGFLAYDGDEVIGKLIWRDDTMEIEKLWVDTSYRREGLATKLWGTAHAAGFNVQHSAWRTDAGEAWAVSIGGDLPNRKKA